MKKKISTGLVGVTLLSLSLSQPLIAEASKGKCQTEAECNAIIQNAQSQISNIKNEQNAVQSEINLVQADIVTIYSEISKTETKISNLIAEINKVETSIAENEKKLEELELEITELKKVVNERIRISHRLSRKNILLTVISESTSIVDFIKQLNAINHFAEHDEKIMKNLKDLVTKQQQIIVDLNQQKQTLAANKANLEAEKANLQSQKTILENKKAQLAKEMQALESEPAGEQAFFSTRCEPPRQSRVSPSRSARCHRRGRACR